LSLLLYLASTNPGKLREFRQGAQRYGVSVESLPNLANLPLCLEDGSTFEENARKKALFYSKTTEGTVFAEDSGLSVNVLGGGPGIYSARFAGAGATDAANNEKLLAEMRRLETSTTRVAEGPAPPGHSAHYTCAIALADRGRLVTLVQGRVEGVILESPRGSGGFGYDPLFFYPPLGQTFAELTSEEKFRVSHRGEAFRKLLEYIKTKG
jgi:XTP/dITP diphosphohydrolase